MSNNVMFFVIPLLRSNREKSKKIVSRQESDQMFAFLCTCLDLHESRRMTFV